MTCRDITPITENEMEENMKNKMEAGAYTGLCSIPLVSKEEWYRSVWQSEYNPPEYHSFNHPFYSFVPC